jgi:hypothetical protein
MNTPLYRLADEYIGVAQVLADYDLADEVIQDTLEGAAGEFEDKCWNIAALILQGDGEVEMMKEAEQRIASRRKSLEGRIEWMRDYALVQMLRTGITEIKSPEFIIKVRENPPKVVCEDESAIPESFKRVSIVVTVLKSEIRKALLDGQEVDGARLQCDKRLTIK